MKLDQAFIIIAGEPQGSVIGSHSYDLPTSDNVTVATYADDIAFFSCHESAVTASEKLLQVLNGRKKY